MKKFFVALMAVAVIAPGCETAKGPVNKDDVRINNANSIYARGRLTQASEKYLKFTEEFPDSPYRRMAILGIADSFYKDKEYLQAEIFYERFIELFPLDPKTPRARFYLAMSYYHQTATHDRDQTNTKKALDNFDTFLAKQPNHSLTPFAKKFRGEMYTMLAENHLEIARFYRRINRNQSAITRLKSYLADFPGSGARPEALYMLGQSYYEEQSYKEAGKVFIELIEGYPDSEYAAKATQLAEKLNLKN